MSKKKNLPAPLKSEDTTLERIIAHHSNPAKFPLSEKESELLERWRRIFTLQLRHNSRMRIVNMLMAEGLSMSQAYADFKNVESLFGNVLKADKDFQRALWLERKNEEYIKALQKGNDELAHKISDSMAKYGGFNDKDDAQFNAEKLENVQIEFGLDPATMALLKQRPDAAKSNVVDFNNFNVVDIAFTEIKDDEAN